MHTSRGRTKQVGQSRVRRHEAFTILELLVTTAVIGSLAGLFLPALMAARESARYLQCSSNLREIGLAIQEHHEVTHRLPEAWTEASDGTSGYGWAVALLPYLEESGLRATIDGQLPIAAAQHDASRNANLTIMRCPSDISDATFELHEEQRNPWDDDEEGSGTTSDHESVVLVRLPVANYMGVFGTLEADDTYPAPLDDGSIVVGRAVRFVDLERGQSHTLLVGERTTEMVPSTWLGVDFQGEDAACRLVGSAVTRPNCDTCDECEFASRHPGGSNFLWADGHVSLVTNEIGAIEYQQLAMRRMD